MLQLLIYSELTLATLMVLIIRSMLHIRVCDLHISIITGACVHPVVRNSDDCPSGHKYIKQGLMYPLLHVKSNLLSSVYNLAGNA
jgi:hypothetical protein